MKSKMTVSQIKDQIPILLNDGVLECQMISRIADRFNLWEENNKGNKEPINEVFCAVSDYFSHW